MLNNYTVLLPLLEDFNIKAMFAVCPAFVNKDIPHIWRDHFFLILKRFVGKTMRFPMDNYTRHIPVTETNQLVLQSDFKKWIYENCIENVYGVIREICYQNEIPYRQESLDPLRFQFMDWLQLQELLRLGHTIASHTYSHRVLKLLSADERTKELLSSKQLLEQGLNTKITAIVYPYGGLAEVDAATIQAAHQAGYQSGFINVSQTYLGDSPMAIPRFGLPFNYSPAQLYSITTGLTEWLKA